MKLTIYLYGIFLAFFFTACENLIEGPDNIPEKAPVTARFSSIQEKVFTPTCAVSGCHSGIQNPNLSAGQSYTNLLNIPSQQNPSMLRVKPGESDQSYLIKKLTGDGTSVMPPTDRLSQAVIDSIASWIDQGAQKN